MSSIEPPDLKTDLAGQIYRAVEREGAVEPAALRDRLDLDYRQFHRGVSELRREGYLEESGGVLRVSLGAGDGTSYSPNGVEYAIRPARQEDLDGIVKVMRRVSDEETYVVAESVAERLLLDETVVRHNAAESRLFFVAETEEGVVGWAHVETSPVESRRHVARQTIGVIEPYRGYGIGGQLLARGLEWAADNGFRKLYNSVPATNEAAIGFLESHGYEVEAVRPDHYSIDGELVDEVQVAVHPAEVVEEGDDRAVTVAWNTAGRLSKAREHLGQSLEADEADAVRYHLREALQYLEFARDDPRRR